MSLPTIEDLNQLQYEADEEQVNLIKRELRDESRHYLLNTWARNKQNDKIFFAMHSAITGMWGDLGKDIERARITLDEALEILYKMLEYGLIIKRTYDAQTDKYKYAHSVFIKQSKSTN